MLNRVKKLFYTDNFSYFIRYFAVFTLIFVSMTLLIFQVMRTTMYREADENFKQIQENPSLVLDFAIMRHYPPTFVEEGSESTSSSSEDKASSPSSSAWQKTLETTSGLKLGTNYNVALYDANGTIVNPDYFSGLADFELDKTNLGNIKEASVQTHFGDKEDYRYITIEISSDLSVYYDDVTVKYATILFNVTQLKSSIASAEKIVVIVMIGFWLISIFASIYLANVSMRPILISFQKQKDFVENASHELRTPLAVLQNRLESLFRHPEATILDSSENIASSLEEVRNMRLLTTNLLNLARRDDGLKPEISDISPDFFDDVFANYEIMAEESGKELEAVNHVTQAIRSDKVLLKQLMTILFDNAMKYSDEDGQIAIEVRIKDRYLVLRVADNGIGIGAEDKKKIFDRFYRVDKARTRQKGGFGLGLSLAKQILTTLHGDVQVKDNHPKGTVFEVKLPR
ncbi:HAMP domain-containing histidine kinase [Streptococcus suis]|nr:HAMP domain-containing histidine kinase [Streptococcus suis]MBY5020535.1 HAMP domain-containing histidine kinase [Streptococcus suis]